MGTIRSKVGLKLGAFFQVTGSVVTAVDNDDEATALKTVCCGDQLAVDKALVEHSPAAVKQLLKCPVCSNTDRVSFGKAKVEGDTFTLVTDEDLAGAAVDPDRQKSIEINVHRASDLAGSALPGGKAYYFAPQAGQEAIYTLFHKMISDTPELAYVAVWAARTKLALYRITTFESALAMEQIAWPTAVQPAPQVQAEYKASDLAMAMLIVNAAVTDYNPAEYKDDRKQALLDVIAAKEGVVGAAIPDAEGVTAAAPTGSLTAMLQAQVAALEAAKAVVPAKKVAAKRAPAKKAAAKKVVAA